MAKKTFAPLIPRYKNRAAIRLLPIAALRLFTYLSHYRFPVIPEKVLFQTASYATTVT